MPPSCPVQPPSWLLSSSLERPEVWREREERQGVLSSDVLRRENAGGEGASGPVPGPVSVTSIAALFCRSEWPQSSSFF